MWLKANPNLGQTVTYETYHLDVERAEKAPASRNDILAKRFGIPMEGYTYFFTYEETLPHVPQEFWQMPCALGADLSQGDDFCAFTFLFPLAARIRGKDPKLHHRTDPLKLQASMRAKYEEFIREGSLHVMDGHRSRHDGGLRGSRRLHHRHRSTTSRALGYDPYNAKEFVTALGGRERSVRNREGHSGRQDGVGSSG